MKYRGESDEEYYGRFKTYRIEKGDTPQSVAKKLGISLQELRRYHNMHCKLADLIEADFKGYTKLIILAPEKSELELEADEIREKKPKKVAFGKDNKLPFQPRGISRDYSVKYTYNIGNLTDALEMGVRVRWLATDNNNYHFFEIRKSINLFIDDKAPDRLMDDIGVKLVQVLYPLNIVVDNEGKWIDIHNYEEIVSRWKNKKEKIVEYYNGGITPKYIEHCELSLASSEQLLKSLYSDHFLRSFFNGMYIKHTDDFVCESEISFPLERNKESKFQIQQKVDPYLNDSNLIKVQQNGDYINLNIHSNLGFELFDGDYNATYFLTPDLYFIKNMNVECKIDFNKAIKLLIEVEDLEK
ncbi:LysM peptidoglycan-binding domain-containing protein [Flavobacterium daemonense]|uniref:LysM peptidoglycan-binding domain-containing protein n=1 Tax=Flavobacterium daemonense TaxID=1393049 RepID=UPI0011860FFF|nr:LysM peptidoglycan-binding domain-containing protein [Flavobacterium daemonense]KAF2333766.1 LysM peptidoglycan-binding domain-containing protein [Flavobacterium daemonense]